MSSQKSNTSKVGTRHPLLLYRFIARRYRPPGVLLIAMGVLLFIPTFVTIPTGPFTVPQLQIIGAASLILGFVLVIGTIIAERQSYVQCLQEYFVIYTMFQRVYCAYQRVNAVYPVQVGKTFEFRSLKKDSEKRLIKPVAGEPAVEVQTTSYPLPEAKLKKMFMRFLFSPRNQGFVFIVPKPTQLSIEMNTFTQNARDMRNADDQRYLDPLERAARSRT